jgi:hypothetical protein
VFLRSRVATIGAISYLIAFVAASIYPRISPQTFAGLPAIMLLWPWIDLIHHSTRATLVAFAALNASIIYAALLLISVLFKHLQRRPS